MPKTSDAVRSAVNRERVRNMKTICLYCRNGESAEYVKASGSNIGMWVHGDAICEAGPIRSRAVQYGTGRRQSSTVDR